MIMANGKKKKKAMRNSWKNKKLLKKKKGFIIYYLVPKRVRDQASGVIYLNAFRIRLISK